MKGILLGLVVCASVFGVARVAAPRPVTRGVVVAPVDARGRAVVERLAEKERLLRRLIAGALRLAEAVDRVLDLNREWPPLPPGRYDHYPGETLRERVAAALVRCAELSTCGDPRQPAITRRLDAELAALAETFGDEGHCVR